MPSAQHSIRPRNSSYTVCVCVCVFCSYLSDNTSVSRILPVWRPRTHAMKHNSRRDEIRRCTSVWSQLDVNSRTGVCLWRWRSAGVQVRLLRTNKMAEHKVAVHIPLSGVSLHLLCCLPLISLHLP